MLQKQIIDISLAQGLNQLTEEKMAQEGTIVLKNARFNKVGEISKTKGWGLTGSAPGYAIATDGKNAVHLIGNSGTISLSSNGWVQTSPYNGSPLVETSFINNDMFDHTETDTAKGGTHLAHVAILRKGSTTQQILITLECLTTGIKISRQDQYPSARTPKVFVHQGFVYLFFGFGTTIILRKYDLTLTEVLQKNVITYNTGNNINGFDACLDPVFNCFFIISPDNPGLGVTDMVTRVDLSGDIEFNITPAPNKALNKNITDYPQFAICTSLSFVATVASCADGTILTIYTKNLLLVKREIFAFAEGDKLTIANITGDEFVVAGSYDEKAEYNGVNTIMPILSMRGFSVSGSTITPGAVDSWERLTLASKAFVYNEDAYCLCKVIDNSNAHFYIFNLTKGTVLGRFSPETAVRTDQDWMTGDYYAFNTLSKVVEIDDGVYSGSIVRKKTVDQSDERRILSSVSSVRVDVNFKENVYSKVSIGDSLLVTNGLTMEIDSGRAYENGFLASPDILRITTSYDTINNDFGGKNYSYCAVYEYYDSDGQLTRSAPSTIKTINNPAQASKMTVIFPRPLKTFKGALNTSSKDPFTVIYRTKHNGTTFYRCGEVKGADSSFDDATLDTDLDSREILYTTGGVLQNDPAPIAKYSVSGGSRVFVAGLEVDEVAFSKKYLTGESIAFSDLFRISTATGGSLDKSKISGLGYMDGKLIIFKRRSIYVVQGDGPNELGQNDSFTVPDIISSDVGCISHSSILNIPDGMLFQSDKGIWLLSRGLALSYLGAGVDDLGRDLIISSVLTDKESEARFFTNNGKCLIYNYTLGQWSSSDVSAISADTINGETIIYNGLHVKKESGFTDIGLSYSMTVKTPWFKTMSIQGFARIWTAKILGKFKSAHKLRIRVYYDYNSASYDEYVREPKLADKQYQYEIHLKRQKCEAIQFEITDLEQSGTAESMALTGVTLEAGIRKGSFKLPATRRT